MVTAGSSFAGDWAPAKGPIDKAPIEDPFAEAIRPISNPTHFDLAIPRTQLHPIFIYNEMPDTVDTILGQVPVGGDYQLYALQFEIALSERLSINATKDGYIVFDPQSVLTQTEGFANLGAGLKYAWLYQPEKKLASNVQLLFEIPLGDRAVWQGTGDGVLIPSVSTLKLAGPFQFAHQFGFKLPLDDNAESTIFYTSAHVSFEATKWFQPLAEISWFSVIDEGDGGPRFGDHIGGALPAVVGFEAGDLVNWGAANANRNPNFVTGALGFRITPPGKPYTFGAAWEAPLTTENEGLLENRFTVDMVWKF